MLIVMQNDMLMWLIDAAIKKGYSHEVIAQYLLVVEFTAMHTTAMVRFAFSIALQIRSHTFALCRRVSPMLYTTSRQIRPWLSLCEKKSKQFWSQKVVIGARALLTSSRRSTVS